MLSLLAFVNNFIFNNIIFLLIFSYNIKINNEGVLWLEKAEKI